MRTAPEHVVNMRTSSDNTTVEDVRQYHSYVNESRRRVTFIGWIRTQGNAYVNGRYVRHRQAYVVAEVTRIRIPNLHYRGVVGISLTESAAETRLFAQTSDGPKCPRTLPKQYHLEMLR